MYTHPKGNFLAGSILLLGLVLLPLVAVAQDKDVPVPELEALKKEYDLLVTSKDGPQVAAVAELDKKYIAGLDRGQETAQEEGKLDDALAIALEKKAISSGGGVPALDAAETPPVLKKMHAIYRSEVAKLELSRANNLKPLRDAYVKKLVTLAMSLTKSGKLEEAMTVKGSARISRQSQRHLSKIRQPG